MNVCRSIRLMSTSDQYILVTHYHIVGPAPRRGAPHAPRSATLGLPYAARPTAAIVGHSTASRVPNHSLRTRTTSCRRKGSLACPTRPSERSTSGWFGSSSRAGRLRDRHRLPGWDWSRIRGLHDRHRAAASRGLGMALDVFPNCRLCKGVQAESLALAEELYRREFLLSKNRDDPIPTNTARAGDKFRVHE